MSDSLILVATGHDEDMLPKIIDVSPIDMFWGWSHTDKKLTFHRFEGDCKGEQAGVWPVPLFASDCVPMMLKWLKGGLVSYGPKPDIDGSCKKGWKVSCNCMSDTLELEPHWMIFHK